MTHACLHYPHFLSLAKVFLLLLVAHQTTAQVVEEVYSLLGPGAEIGSATVDRNGNLYLFGRLNGTVDFDVKEGTFPLTSDGVDLFIAKYDPDGNRQYAKRIQLDLPEGSSTGPGEIAADTEGNVYVCGSYRGTIFFEGSNRTESVTNDSDRANSYVAKYDIVGNNVFYRTLSDRGDIPQDNFATNAALTSDGHLYLLGRFRGTIDFNPSAGEEELITNQENSSDLFLIKYTTEGAYVKTTILGGTDYEAARRLKVDNADNIIIAGHFKNRIRLDPNSSSDTFVKDSTRSFFVAKYNSDMELLHATPIYRAVDTADQGLEGRIRLFVDESRNIFVTAHFNGTLEVEETQLSTSAEEEGNFFVAKYSAGGELIFVRQYGGVGYEEPREFTVDDAGAIYLSGVFRGSLDLDGNLTDDNRISAGEEDAFLAKLTDEGAFQSVVHFSSSRAVLAKELFRLEETLYFIGNFSEAVRITNSLTINGSPFDEERNDAFIVKYDITPPPPPRITALSPTVLEANIPGSLIISGENFGDAIDSVIVELRDGDRLITATDVQVNGTGTQITVTTPPLAVGNYGVQVSVGNQTVIAEEAVSVTDEPVVKADQLPPTIVLNAPSLLNKEDATFAVNSEVRDASGVGSVTLEFLPIRKNPRSDDWRKISGSQEGTTDTYIAQLTDTDLDELGVQTRIIATDAVGNSDTSAIQYTFRNYTTTQPLAVEELSPTRDTPSANDYNLFCIPLQNQSVRQAFGELGEYNTRRWRAWQLGSNGQADAPYQEFSRGWTGELQAGQGYLLIYTEETAFQTTGPVVEATYDTPFTLVLPPGFTLIGNPYPFALDWNQVLTFNGLDTEDLRLKTFRGGFQPASRLEAFQGGLVVNPDPEETITLKFPVGPVVSRGREGPQAEGTGKAVEAWQVDLELRSGGICTQARLGMHPEAQVGVDRYDDFTPPRLADWPQLSSNHEEFFLPKLSQDVVPSGMQHIWHWVVAAPPHQEVTLQWKSEEVGRLEERLTLADEEGAVRVDMRHQRSYSLRTGQSGKRIIKMVYGNPDELSEPAAHLQVGHPYPNPTADQLHLPVVVPSEEVGPLHLQILDATGRLVSEQVYDGLEPGRHTLTWQREASQSGRSFTRAIPGGLYLFRLRGQTTVTGRFVVE